MKRMRWIVVAGVVAMGACDDDGTPGDGDTDPSAGSMTTTAADSGTDGADAGGLLVGGHGFVRLLLERSPNAVGDPFVGTVRISATLLYLECSGEFYDAHPEQQQGGSEGAVVFEAAMMDLCQPETGGIACTIAEISQELDAARQLTVLYDVEQPIEGGTLRVGPLPTAELATCGAGGLPLVRLGSNGAVRGLDAEGNTVWITESFVPDQAAPGQGAPITVHAIQSP